MIKKTITFEDLDGKQVDEEWWFNLNKGDLVELSVGNDLADQIRTIANASDTGSVDAKSIIPAFKGIISMSVGKRVNNRFMRSPEITAEFMGSEAYSELVFELLSDASKAAEFVNGLMPTDMLRQIENIQLPADNVPTTQDLLTMTDEQFYATVGENPRKWSKDVTAIAMKRKTMPQAA